MPLQGDQAHLRQLLQGVVASVRPLMREAGIRLACHFAEAALPVPGDGPALQQIVLILLNSARTRVAGGGRITLWARNETDAVVVEVAATESCGSRSGQGGIRARTETDAVRFDAVFGTDLSLATHLAERIGGTLSVDVPDGFAIAVRLRLDRTGTSTSRRKTLALSGASARRARGDNIL